MPHQEVPSLVPRYQRARQRGRTSLNHLLLPLLLQLLLTVLNSLRLTVVASELDGGAAALQSRIFLNRQSEYRGTIKKLVRLDRRVACPGEPSGTLSCPEGTQIVISSVALNQQATGECRRLAANFSSGVGNTKGLLSAALSRCTVSKAERVIRIKCEEKQHCRLVTARPTVLRSSDPYQLESCAQLTPLLTISYACEPNISSRLLCADTYATIACEDSQRRLLLLDAILTDRHLYRDAACPSTANPEQGAARCPDRSALAGVRTDCGGRQTCTVGAAQGAGLAGCARPNLLLAYACVPRKSIADPTKPLIDRYPDGNGGGGGGRGDVGQAGRPPRPDRGSGGSEAPGGGLQADSRPQPPPVSREADAAVKDADNGVLGNAPLLGACAAGGLALLLVASVAGCLATRRYLAARRRREEERLARVHLSKQIPPPSTCLPMPAAEALLKLPAPLQASDGQPASQTVSVCLSGQLNSPPQTASTSSAADAGSDRQSSSTSTFLTGTTGSGSIPSPRESLATYSVHRNHCASAVLHEINQQLAMI